MYMCCQGKQLWQPAEDHNAGSHTWSLPDPAAGVSGLPTSLLFAAPAAVVRRILDCCMSKTGSGLRSSISNLRSNKIAKWAPNHRIDAHWQGIVDGSVVSPALTRDGHLLLPVALRKIEWAAAERRRQRLESARLLLSPAGTSRGRRATKHVAWVCRKQHRGQGSQSNEAFSLANNLAAFTRQQTA